MTYAVTVNLPIPKFMIDITTHTAAETCKNVCTYATAKIGDIKWYHFLFAYCMYIWINLHLKPIAVEKLTKRGMIKLLAEYMIACIASARISMSLRDKYVEAKSLIGYMFWVTLWMANTGSFYVASLFVPRLRSLVNGLKTRVLHSIDSVLEKITSAHRIINNPDLAECIICMGKAVTLNFLYPCGHGVLCTDCKDKIDVCPVCRKDVNDNIRVFPST